MLVYQARPPLSQGACLYWVFTAHDKPVVKILNLPIGRRNQLECPMKTKLYYKRKPYTCHDLHTHIFLSCKNAVHSCNILCCHVWRWSNYLKKKYQNHCIYTTCNIFYTLLTSILDFSCFPTGVSRIHRCISTYVAVKNLNIYCSNYKRRRQWCTIHALQRSGETAGYSTNTCWGLRREVVRKKLAEED